MKKQSDIKRKPQVRETVQGLQFERRPDGTTIAKVNDADTATRSHVTYLEIAPELHKVRVVVIGDKLLTVEKLKKKFPEHTLASKADDADWKDWKDNFSQEKPGTAKNAALVFIEKKTGLKRSTLKSLWARLGK